MAITRAATYGGDPANSPLDAVRLMLGDTDCADACLGDDEILWRLGQFGDNALRAAACAARDIAGKFARKVNYSAGKVRRDLSSIFDHYLQLADELDGKANSGGSLVEFYVGGISRDEKTQDARDTDLPAPYFEFGQFDNPEAFNRLRGSTK